MAAFSSVLGLALGLACGYFRRVDGFVMRIMDGLMAIPSILLAIASTILAPHGCAAARSDSARWRRLAALSR